MSFNEYVYAAAADQSRNRFELEGDNSYGRGIVVGIGAESVATGSLTVSILGKDRASEKYYTILSSAAIASSGFSTLKVYPGISASANVSVSDILPYTYKVTAVATSGAIFSLGWSIIE